MSKKIVAILQARTDSSRLPGKVLMPILDKPMIIHQLERVARSEKITHLILATSVDRSDDELASIVTSYHFDLFRGSKTDVLGRFYDAAKMLNLKDDDWIIRLTGDCPLQEAKIIDELIVEFEKQNVDYMANCIIPVYPDGFDAEIFTFKALKECDLQATFPSEREHVTPWIRENGSFKIANLEKEDASVSQLRLTVDEPEDAELVKIIYNHFGNNTFSYEEILRFLAENPHYCELNASYMRNEGYLKSLQEDKRSSV
jgi:spore coat polysaccharide biosynthesis protein SpsF (cytidylyltransferase family)